MPRLYGQSHAKKSICCARLPPLTASGASATLHPSLRKANRRKGGRPTCQIAEREQIASIATAATIFRSIALSASEVARFGAS